MRSCFFADVYQDVYRTAIFGAVIISNDMNRWDKTGDFVDISVVC